MTPTHSDDGVDLTLIRWMLSLTPGERLAVLQDQADSLLRLREKFDSGRAYQPQLSGLPRLDS